LFILCFDPRNIAVSVEEERRLKEKKRVRRERDKTGDWVPVASSGGGRKEGAGAV
jgi:hypothetical protein